MKKKILAILMSLALIVGLAPGVTAEAATAEGHSHEDSSSTTWTELKRNENRYTKFVDSSGNYYLGESIDHRIVIKSGVSAVLCLNGQKIEIPEDASSYEEAIAVESGASLTICDCASGGEISNTNKNGSYVIDNDGDLTILSGKIINEAVSTGYGIINSGNVYVKGGEIIGSSNSTSGIGLCNAGNAYVSGGKIESAKSMALTVEDGAKLYLSGAPVISGGETEINVRFEENAAPYVYAASDGTTTGAVYTGGALEITIHPYGEKPKAGDILVYNSTDTEKFVLKDWNDTTLELSAVNGNLVFTEASNTPDNNPDNNPEQSVSSVNVNGQTLTSGQYITGSGTPTDSAAEPSESSYAWYKDSELILKDFAVTTKATTDGAMISSTENLTVQLKGTNTITGVSSADGISTGDADLTIKGTGSLEIKSVNGGISAGTGSINIESGAIDITASETGIYTNRGKVNISGGTVDVTGVIGVNSHQSRTDGINISGGTVSVTSTGIGESAFYCGSETNISGGNVTVNVSGKGGFGFNGWDEVEITGGTVVVNATGKNSTAFDDGLSVKNATKVTVNATGTGASAFQDSLSIDNTEVVAKSDGKLIDLWWGEPTFKNCLAYASTNVDASDLERYDNDKNDTYHYLKTTSHTHTYAQKSDKDGHWTECNCGVKTEVVAHTPNVEAATDETAKYCTVCNYELEARIVPEILLPDEDTTDEDADADVDDDDFEDVEEDADAEDVTEKEAAPETGDSNDIMLWAALLIMSIAVIFGRKKMICK